MNLQSDYCDRYAEYAMKQMRLYGIPASVTLAQGMLESGTGTSKLARNGNNHFGIKATKAWLDAGGAYGCHTDDKPNEKFRYYSSVADSYEDHSKFLKENSRYAKCFDLRADDYTGWARGLQKAGYATDPNYAKSLVAMIEKYDLAKYDKMVMQGEYVGPSQTEGQTEGSSQDKKAKVDLTQSPDTWLHQIFSSSNKDGESESQSEGYGGDPIMELVMGLFTSLMLLATQLDNKQQAAEQVNATKSVDLSPLTPSFRDCQLRMQGDKATLTVNGSAQKQLTPAELQRLSQTVNDPNLTDEQKRSLVGSMVTSMMAPQLAQANYERISAEQSQSQYLRR